MLFGLKAFVQARYSLVWRVNLDDNVAYEGTKITAKLLADCGPAGRKAA